MCAWGDTVPVLVPISAAASHTGKFRWDTKPVDRCIAELVRVLIAVGVFTAGSCCGHGKGRGEIILDDGRKIDPDVFRDIDGSTIAALLRDQTIKTLTRV